MEEIFESISWLRFLRAEDAARLKTKARVIELAPGKTSARRGEPVKEALILLEGLLEKTASGEEGSEKSLGMVEPGGVCTPAALVTGEPWLYDLVARKSSKALLIPLDILLAAVLKSEQALAALAAEISRELSARKADPGFPALLQQALARRADPYGLSLSFSPPLKILVINCGSSSLKYRLFDTGKPELGVWGVVERIGEDRPLLRHYCRGKEEKKELDPPIDHRGAFRLMLEALRAGPDPLLRDLSEITAVGHRVVHGGEVYTSSVPVDERVLENLRRLCRLAPLHNPVNLLGIEESIRHLPSTLQVAVFDTAFHHRLPRYARVYALPREFHEKHGIRRYGFHGLSHHFATLRASEFLGKPLDRTRLITCHLGNGASLSAVAGGRCVDTSMGLTPAEGLVMGTRCGDLDPAIPVLLQKEMGMTAEQVDELINKKSGLLGLSGVSNDMREIQERALAGDENAALAVQVFCHRVRKYLGAYLAHLGSADAVVFTGGIGEGSSFIRTRCLAGMEELGIEIDEEKNRSRKPGPGEILEISADSARIRVLVIPAEEDRMIARETLRAFMLREDDEKRKIRAELKFPLRLLPSHVHLSPEEGEKILGKQTSDSLGNKGEDGFTPGCRVTLCAGEARIPDLPVKVEGPGPARAELSQADLFTLGLDLPSAWPGVSGNLKKLVARGSGGEVPVIEATELGARLYLKPEHALRLGVREGDKVRMKVSGKRTFEVKAVEVKVDPARTPLLHLPIDLAGPEALTKEAWARVDEIESRD